MTHSARATTALRALQEDDPAIAALSLWCAHRDAAEGVAQTAADTILYGPGFAALAIDPASAAIFVIAMFAGMAIVRLIEGHG